MSDTKEALVERLAGLLAKVGEPNGLEWTLPWRVVPCDGKPIIAGNKSGNLFRGYIATWQEADLIVAVVNALPDMIAALSSQTPPAAADYAAKAYREGYRDGYIDRGDNQPDPDKNTTASADGWQNFLSSNPLPAPAPTDQGVAIAEGEAEAIADAVATALAKYSVAYSHNTVGPELRTTDRMWRVHETGHGNPFERNEWLGEFDNKADASAACAALRRNAAIEAARAFVTPAKPAPASVDAMREAVADLAAIGPRPAGKVLAWADPRPCYYKNTDLNPCGHCCGCRERIAREVALDLSALPAPSIGEGS